MRPLFAVLLLGGAVDETVLRKKLGCDEGCSILSVESVHVRAGRTDTAVRTRRTGHCGVVADWTLLDADWKPLLTIDEEVDRSCSGHEEHRRLHVVIDKDVVKAGDVCWRGDTHLTKFTCKSN
jgi:hypothetical protein